MKAAMRLFSMHSLVIASICIAPSVNSAAVADHPFEQLSSSIYVPGQPMASGWKSLPGTGAVRFAAHAGSASVKNQAPNWRGVVLLAQDDPSIIAIAPVPPFQSGSLNNQLSADPADWSMPLNWTHQKLDHAMFGEGCFASSATVDDTLIVTGVCNESTESGSAQIVAIACNFLQHGENVESTCKTTATATAVLGSVQDVALGLAPADSTWIATSQGLYLATAVGTGMDVAPVVTGYNFNAVACSPMESGTTAGLVVAGGADRMYYVQSPGTASAGRMLSAPAVLGYEWVTVIESGAGGVYDDEITALAFVPSAAVCSNPSDPFQGALIVGTRSVVNVRWSNGTVIRIPGWAGLPMGNATSIAIQRGLDVSGRCITRVAVGTTTGLAIATLPQAEAVGDHKALHASSVASPGGVGRPAGSWAWQWLRHGRWLPGEGISLLTTSTGVRPGDLFLLAATEAEAPCTQIHSASSPGPGIAIIDGQSWTLAQKSTRMWNTNDARHNRFGMVGESDLSAFGRVQPALQGASDNQGLWTSVVLAAAAWQLVLGQNDSSNSHTLLSPSERVQTYFSGMELLNNVTGIDGLMARSCLDPSTPPPHGDTAWHNSTSMPGWTWKGTTSSDEVVGHTFAFSTINAAARAAAGSSPDRQMPSNVLRRSNELLRNIAVYIVTNNFTLKDWNGEPTHWGHWDPAHINENRSWSDNRGVSSLEAAALLVNAYDAAMELNDTTAASIIMGGWKKLFTPASSGGAGYGSNLLNVKIEAPCDDNFSDDELTFLPYYAYFGAASLEAMSSALPHDAGIESSPAATALSGLRRTWNFVAPTHPDLWAAVFASVALDGTCTARASQGDRPQPGGGCFVPPSGVDQAELDSIAAGANGNLRAWPLDSVQWPVQNSDRWDVWLDPEENRDGRASTEAMEVLPANERCQGRWNANPHDLDGCNGMVEMDSGVYLAPYWLGRAHGLIGNEVNQIDVRWLGVHQEDAHGCGACTDAQLLRKAD